MSAQFNDTNKFKGIVQLYEREIGQERGYISGNTNRLIELTAAVNMTWDRYLALALPASGRWQYDDSGHTDFPIIKTNIVSGQKDYTFTTDGSGNLILDIYKVAILPDATVTEYDLIFPIDTQSQDLNTELITETTQGGTPVAYDKTANGLLFEPTFDYAATNGIKVYINREPSYFVDTDTTKLPGCPGLHHEYFAIRPAFDYARRNNLAIAEKLREEVVNFEGDEKRGIQGSIVQHFARRSRDERDMLVGEGIIYE